jgi:hypothetical protein
VLSQCNAISVETADVPLPINSLLAVNVFTPVPPYATAKTPDVIYVADILPVYAPPLIIDAPPYLNEPEQFISPTTSTV